MLAAIVIPGINVLELRAQNAGVKIIQSTVEAVTVNVARVRTMVAQLADDCIDLLVVRHQGAAVTKSAQILLNDKTRRCRVAKFRNLEPLPMRADCLGVVLDDKELVLVRDFADSLHVGA